MPTECSSPELGSILYTVKNILTIISIIAPILLMVMSSIHIINLIKDPDDKKKRVKIKNSAIAAVVIFIVPTLVNATMYLLGDSFTISDCWNKAQKPTNTTKYIDTSEGKRTVIYTNPSEYQGGEKKKPTTSNSGTGNSGNTGSTYNGTGYSGNTGSTYNGTDYTDDTDGTCSVCTGGGTSDSTENSGNTGSTIDGTARQVGDVVWDPNDVTKISNLTSSQLIAILNKHGEKATNFIPYASSLITTEQKYSVNVFFLLGVQALESGWVTSKISQNCNNLGGVRESKEHPSNGCGSNSGGGFAYFNSVAEFNDYHGYLLHNKYLTPGGPYYRGTSPSAVVVSYCPGCTTWPDLVTSIANKLFKHVSEVL